MTGSSSGSHAELASLLRQLRLEGDPLAETKARWPPLCLASYVGNTELVGAILQDGADVDASTEDGWTSLNLVCQENHLQICKQLLDSGADLSLSNMVKRCPLFTACQYGNYEIVKLLLGYGAQVSNTEKANWTPLLVAADRGYLAIVRILLEHGANIEDRTDFGETPFMRATVSGHRDVAKLLLEKGAGTNVCNNGGTSVLLAAVTLGHLKIVSLLLENGADALGPNPVGPNVRTPLLEACVKGYIEIAKMILEHGVNITAADHDGWAPLHAACQGGHTEMVKWLIEQGADVTATAERGQTPLHVAAFYGKTEVVQQLLENGAEIDATDCKQQTAIYLTVLQGNVRTFEFLLESDADFIASSENGDMPIHLAAALGNIEIVKRLIGKGAILWVENKDNLTPIRLAANNNHAEVVVLLLEHYGDVGIDDTEDDWVPASPTISNALVAFTQNPGAEMRVHRRVASGNSKLDMLCNTCRRLFSHKRGCLGSYGSLLAEAGAPLDSWAPRSVEEMFGQGQPFIHHLTAHGLRAASSAGCYICRRIWHGVDPTMQERLLVLDVYALCQDSPRPTFTFLLLMDRNSFQNAFPKYPDVSVSEHKRLDYAMLFAFEGTVSRALHGSSSSLTSFSLISSHDAQEYNIDGDLDRSTASKTSFSFIETCFKACLQNHDTCNTLRKTSWLPTRLVCLEKLESHHSVHLVMSENLSSGPYFSLSHCWGSIEIYKLTTNTLEELCHGIPISKLPRAFQDSCYISYRLGVRYIWIDSLCIIQDVSDDWLKEASQMHLVYENALCNICATGFPDSSQGIYVTRDPEEFRPFDVEIPWLDRRGGFRILDSTLWDRQILDAPLNKRAWVTQERLLAPRHLHFGAKQVFWECLEVTAAEQFSRGIPPMLAVKNSTQSSRKVLHTSGQIQSREDRDELLSSGWTSAVETFMKSRLTYDKDKVMAFAGITKRFEALLQEECYHGLWKKDIECHLVWRVQACRQGDDSPSTRPTTYRAPSFSWLSVEGRIQLAYFPHGEDIVAEVASATGASIRIKCPLKPLRLGRHVSSVGVFWRGISTMEFDREFQTVESIGGMVADMDVDQAYDDVYYGALIRTNIFDMSYAAGIVLRETGKRKGEFERIGAFSVHGQGEQGEQGKQFFIDRNHDEETYPSESYDASKNRHLLSIV